MHTVQIRQKETRDSSPGKQHAKPNTEIRCETLRPRQYGEWDALVDRSPHGTVFHYSWWLENVANTFEILGVYDSGGALVGGIPLPRSRRYTLDLVHCPPLAPYLGPIFDISEADSVCDRLFLMRSWGEALARGIHAFDSFRCIAGAAAPDLQGFLWAGFRVGLAYTFRFPAGCGVESVASAMTRTHLQKLNKAEKLGVTVTLDDDVRVLLDLNHMTFARQGMAATYSPDLVERLWTAANQRGCARIYVAHTADGLPAAALLTVHDDRTVYQIVSGVNWNLRDVQGGFLVLWRAIQDALFAGCAFDFEGSAIRGVEAYYRRWGALAAPVWRIEKAATWRGKIFQDVIRRRETAAAQASSSHSVSS